MVVYGCGMHCSLCVVELVDMPACHICGLALLLPFLVIMVVFVNVKVKKEHVLLRSSLCFII